MEYKRKIKLTIIMFLTIIMMMSVYNICFAGSGKIETSGVTIQYSDNEFQLISESILGFVQILGSAVAVIMIVVIGIRYMLGSVEEKAEKKQTFIYYLIGAVLIFITVNIVSIVYNALT